MSKLEDLTIAYQCFKNSRPAASKARCAFLHQGHQGGSGVGVGTGAGSGSGGIGSGVGGAGGGVGDGDGTLV